MAKRTKPPRSPIYNDPNRSSIERALALGVSMKEVARRFGYTPDAISRHRNKMPAQLKAAIAAAVLKPKETDLDQLRADEAEGILGNLALQRARLLVCQDECLEAGAAQQVSSLARVIHDNIKLTGHYLGLFAQHHVSTNVNLLVSEDYLRVRQILTQALRPFPEARRAVAEALHRAEGDMAQRALESRQPRAAAPPAGPPAPILDAAPDIVPESS